MELNEKQKRAVESVEGIYNVSSGAGTGKTTVVAHRIANMIKNLKIPSEQILAITYTNTAADEMKKRIELICGKGVNSHISTIHVFAKTIIDRYLPDGQSLMWGVTDLCQKALEVSTKLDRFNAMNVMRCIGEIEGGRRELSDFTEEIQEYYKKYIEFLKKIKRISFDGALNILNELLDDEKILSDVRNTYKYIVVDEFQDVNRVQFEIIKKLTGEDGNLFVVGDMNQSIYGFNGSELEIMANFTEHFPESEVIDVNENYRSGENIIEVANTLLENSEIKSEPLNANKEKLGGINVELGEYSQDLYEMVANTIEDNVKNGGAYKDNCIIARTNWELTAVSKVLRNKNIPFKIYSQSYTDMIHVIHIFEHIMFMENKLDSLSTYDMIGRYFGLMYENAEEIYDSVIKNDTLRWLLTKGEEFTELGELLWKLRDKYVEITDKNVKDVIIDICETADLINEKSYKKCGLLYRKEDRYMTSADLEKFLNSIDEALKRKVEFKGFREFVKLVESFEFSGDSDDVKLLTGHRAKGLEFKNVHVLNVTDDVFPMIKDNIINEFATNYKSREEEIRERIEEERRLFYVIITRAMESLTLYVPLKKKVMRKTVDVIPSRFIADIHKLLDSFKMNKK
jgi:ATP-dependent DNA helicase pcrA